VALLGKTVADTFSRCTSGFASVRLKYSRIVDVMAVWQNANHLYERKRLLAVRVNARTGTRYAQKDKSNHLLRAAVTTGVVSNSAFIFLLSDSVKKRSFTRTSTAWFTFAAYFFWSP
jgi:hypothetical protein